MLKEDNGRLIIVSFTKGGLSFKAKINLMARFIKYFGKPPTNGIGFTIKKLETFLADYDFVVEVSRLLGEEMSKAIF